MKTKVIVGVSLAIVMLGLIYIGRSALMAILIFGAVMGMWEYYGLLRIKNVKTMPMLGIGFGLSFIIFAYLERFSHLSWPSMGTVVSIYVFMILVIQFWQIVGHRAKYTMIEMAATVFGSLYIGAFMSFFVLIMNAADKQFPHDTLANRLVIMLPMFSSWFNDAGAYFFGSFFGKNRIFPELSPKKTLEGCLGGIFVTMVAFFFISFKIHIPAFHAIILGGVAAAFGQVGDLSESAFKRELNVKDSGRVFAGHGGFLDRMDSFLFTVPVVYHYFLWFNPWHH